MSTTSRFDAATLNRPSGLARQKGAPRLLQRLGKALVRRAIDSIATGSVRLIDGDGIAHSRNVDAALGVTVRVNDPAFYAAAAFGGGLGVAESYMDGHWETDDLPLLVETMATNWASTRALDGPLSRLLAPVSLAAYWLERNSRAGSRRNIRAHYDLGNDFFSLFLDPSMMYSSAIFENGAATLEEAQREKMDRVCRKLMVTPADHILEVGTGWGSMAIHAAATHGCRVTTTTISDEQFRFATKRVSEAGLSDRITVIKRDYRDLTGCYDKIISIEMIEAVGRSNIARFFAGCSRLLKPDGAALIQSIVIRDQHFEAAARRRDFLKKYIFPGSCLPGVRFMMDAVASRTDLRLWHFEEIGPHYATTLRMWREAFLSRLHDVRALGFDQRFIRMWEYYLAYCEGAFRARHVGDVQMLLTKPLCRLSPVGASPNAAEPTLRAAEVR